MGPVPGGYISEQIGERGGGRPKAKCIRRFKFDTQEIPLSSAEASKEEEKKEEKNTKKNNPGAWGILPRDLHVLTILFSTPPIYSLLSSPP